MKPSKRQTALSGLLLFLLILGAYVVGFVGWGSPKGGADTGLPELTLVQTGVASCTITVTSCSVTTIYSPAYSSVPVLHVTPQTVFTGTSSATIVSSLFFQSGSDLNWVNMPAADTEIYGDTLGDHRLTANWAGASTFRFGYSCPINSNTAGAYLTIQYSIDGGSTFPEVNTAQRAIIDNTLCPNGSGFGSATYSSIPAAAQVNNVILRIIGHGGGGVGDTPRFSELWVEWPTSFTVSNVAQWKVCASSLVCGTQSDSGKTSFFLQVQVPFQISSSTTFRFTWSAGLPV